jgi:hypothetical protein
MTGVDDRGVQDIVDFRVRGVFFSGIMAAPREVIAGPGEDPGRIDHAAEIRQLAGHGHEAVDSGFAQIWAAASALEAIGSTGNSSGDWDA